MGVLDVSQVLMDGTLSGGLQKKKKNPGIQVGQVDKCASKIADLTPVSD